MYDEYLSFALKLARSAGDYARDHFQQHKPTLKPDGTEVTETDRAIERLMRATIARAYPSHGILGEEYGPEGTEGNDLIWALDPIDGTSWYTMGAPIFGTLVALVEHGEPVVGVIHIPLLQETVYAGKGLGCWLSAAGAPPHRISVRSPSPLRRAVVTASGVQRSDILPREGEAAYNLRAVMRASAKFKFYGDCVQHVLVCRGYTHAAIDTVMSPWDSAAVIPCIEEAGGIATTINGDRQGAVFGGSLITSCHGNLHEELLHELHRYPWDDSGWDTSGLLKRKTG